MEWTEEAIATLKSLWSEGRSARDIGERLGGVSRNAVIGKAHRLGLSKQSKPREEAATDHVAAKHLTEKMCRWPIGHPGDPDFSFCGKGRLAGRPYCGEHCAVAYRGRAEEAA